MRPAGLKNFDHGICRQRPGKDYVLQFGIQSAARDRCSPILLQLNACLREPQAGCYTSLQYFQRGVVTIHDY
jgi:hypothetical protein